MYLKKIYIIGPVGSGKTTFSNNLSKKFNIKAYELDKIVWDDEKSMKRKDEEIIKLFNKILKNDSWIIEDIGREKLKKGRYEADVIYYIKISKIKSYYRVIKRWIKQRLRLEKYNQYPSLEQLKYFLSIVKSYYKKEKSKIKSLEEFNDKVIFINCRGIKKILNKKMEGGITCNIKK